MRKHPDFPRCVNVLIKSAQIIKRAQIFYIVLIDFILEHMGEKGNKYLKKRKILSNIYKRRKQSLAGLAIDFYADAR